MYFREWVQTATHWGGAHRGASVRAWGPPLCSVRIAAYPVQEQSTLGQCETAEVTWATGCSVFSRGIHCVGFDNPWADWSRVWTTFPGCPVTLWLSAPPPAPRLSQVVCLSRVTKDYTVTLRYGWLILKFIVIRLYSRNSVTGQGPFPPSTSPVKKSIITKVTVFSLGKVHS